MTAMFLTIIKGHTLLSSFTPKLWKEKKKNSQEPKHVSKITVTILHKLAKKCKQSLMVLEDLLSLYPKYKAKIIFTVGPK